MDPADGISGELLGFGTSAWSLCAWEYSWCSMMDVVNEIRRNWKINKLENH